MVQSYPNEVNLIGGSWRRHGGSCTCPNGQTYTVGDNYDSCSSLHCIGGVSGTCEFTGYYVGKGVTCGSATAPPVLKGGRVWPTGTAAAFTNSSAVSRRVAVKVGKRYWLGLTCTSPANVHPTQPETGKCAVGARFHTDRLPRKMRLYEPSGRIHRRLSGLGQVKSACGDILDRGLCAQSLNRYNEPCVAASTVFSNGKVCMESQWVVRYEPDAPWAMATCPSMFNLSTNSAVPRAKLPDGVGCESIRDRAQCCASVDGRTQAIHKGQPCVAAQVQFLDGRLC